MQSCRPAGSIRKRSRPANPPLQWAAHRTRALLGRAAGPSAPASAPASAPGASALPRAAPRRAATTKCSTCRAHRSSSPALQTSLGPLLLPCPPRPVPAPTQAQGWVCWAARHLARPLPQLPVTPVSQALAATAAHWLRLGAVPLGPSCLCCMPRAATPPAPLAVPPRMPAAALQASSGPPCRSSPLPPCRLRLWRSAWRVLLPCRSLKVGRCTSQQL